MSTPTSNLRAKIDTMVKKAIVKTLFEAPVRNNPKNIYASEDYTSIWDALPEGVPGDEPSVSATQSDFKRWFIRNYLESNTSPLRLEPSERDQLLAEFEAMDPNQMVEWINANPNELFSFSPYENDPMALVKILAAYTNSKGVRQRMHAQSGLIDQMSNAQPGVDAPEPPAEKTGRMTQDDSETSLQAVQNMVSGDATERLNSRQAVDNRIKTAMGKLAGSAEVKMIVRYLLNRSNDKNDVKHSTTMEMIDQLHDKVLEATADYTDLFVDSMFEAFSKVGFPEEGESDSEAAYSQQAAFNAAVSTLVPNASANDIAIFKKALTAPMGDGTTVHETILNKSASDPGVRDALVKAVMEVFENNKLDLEAGFYSDAGSDGDAKFEAFVGNFVDSMFDAFREEGPELQQAFAEGVADLSAKLRAAGVRKGIGSQEIGVFESILLSDVDGNRRIVDIFINGDAEDPAAYDEVWEASFEKFKSELDKQTLFNSIGDYIDIQPDVVNMRHAVFNTVKSGADND